MCDDFNGVLSQDEKWGLKPATFSRIRYFKDCLVSCGFVNLGYTRQKYTWFYKRDNGHVVFQRLDRFLGNDEFLNVFPHAVVSHLPRIKSDHNPILFSSKLSSFNFRPRPFCCERIWINQPDFVILVAQLWHDNPNQPIYESLDLFKTQVLHWNKHALGNLFQREKIIFARLNGINTALSSGPNMFLVSLQNELSLELQ